MFDKSRTGAHTRIALSVVCAATFLFFADRSPIPDIAWLIEASHRWVDGAELYTDIIEVNPPLIFYETVTLTGGLFTPRAYVAGVCIVMCISSLWVERMRGPFVGAAALTSMLVGGLTDFGQRDHLALIFVIPYLLGCTANRNALGLWAFFGVGLKPYLTLIPFASTLSKAVIARSPRLLAAELNALFIAYFVYVIAIIVAHPAYFAEIVPLGQFVYWAYGAAFKIELVGLSIAIGITALVPFVVHENDLKPLAIATLAAVASYYTQGRNWSYHFVPAIGLAILLALCLAQRHGKIWVLASVLIAGQLWRGPHGGIITPSIPANVSKVAYLSAHVFSAYPESLECSVRNVTRYPALWPLPGAWNIAHDRTRPLADRRRALQILENHRAMILHDIAAGKPDVIFADNRRLKTYFHEPFDYVDFLGGLPGYRRSGTIWFYDIWTQTGVPPRGRCKRTV